MESWIHSGTGKSEIRSQREPGPREEGGAWPQLAQRTSIMLCASDTAPDEPSSVISVGSLLWSICIVAPENCGAHSVNNSGVNDTKAQRNTRRNAREKESAVASAKTHQLERFNGLAASARQSIELSVNRATHQVWEGDSLHSDFSKAGFRRCMQAGEDGAANTAMVMRMAHLPITRPTRSLRKQTGRY